MGGGGGGGGGGGHKQVGEGAIESFYFVILFPTGGLAVQLSSHVTVNGQNPCVKSVVTITDGLRPCLGGPITCGLVTAHPSKTKTSATLVSFGIGFCGIIQMESDTPEWKNGDSRTKRAIWM